MYACAPAALPSLPCCGCPQVTGADASAVLSMVAAGVCQGGVVSQADFDLYSLNALANPHCNLEVALTATSSSIHAPMKANVWTSAIR